MTAPRAKTESLRTLERSREERRHLTVINGGQTRPRTRGDCASVPRPCPWVGCRYSLFLDVTDIGTIKYFHGDKEPDQVDPEWSCALDVADRGGASLLEIGKAWNMTRERPRQDEERALLRLFRRPSVLTEFLTGPAAGPSSAGLCGSGKSRAKPPAESGDESFLAFSSEEGTVDDAADEDASASFFAHGERSDALVCKSVWRMFPRTKGVR